MSKRHWMPFYFGDYFADAHHLSTIEHGAYFLLLAHCWQFGSLPEGDEERRQITKLSQYNWKKFSITLNKFFLQNGHHKRIDKEIQRIEEIREKRRKAALKRIEIMSANAEQKLSYLQLQSQSQRKEEYSVRGASAPSAEKGLFQRGKEVLGPKAGGLVVKILQARDGNIALARSVIETASTKENPLEYVGAVLRGYKNGNRVNSSRTQERKSAFDSGLALARARIGVGPEQNGPEGNCLDLCAKEIPARENTLFENGDKRSAKSLGNDPEHQ